MKPDEFRKKILHAGFLPQALVHYLVAAAESIDPGARERIAKKLDIGKVNVVAAAGKATRQMNALKKAA